MTGFSNIEVELKGNVLNPILARSNGMPSHRKIPAKESCMGLTDAPCKRKRRSRDRGRTLSTPRKAPIFIRVATSPPGSQDQLQAQRAPCKREVRQSIGVKRSGSKAGVCGHVPSNELVLNGVIENPEALNASKKRRTSNKKELISSEGAWGLPLWDTGIVELPTTDNTLLNGLIHRRDSRLSNDHIDVDPSIESGSTVGSSTWDEGESRRSSQSNPTGDDSGSCASTVVGNLADFESFGGVAFRVEAQQSAPSSASAVMVDEALVPLFNPDVENERDGAGLSDMRKMKHIPRIPPHVGKQPSERTMNEVWSRFKLPVPAPFNPQSYSVSLERTEEEEGYSLSSESECDGLHSPIVVTRRFKSRRRTIQHFDPYLLTRSCPYHNHLLSRAAEVRRELTRKTSPERPTQSPARGGKGKFSEELWQELSSGLNRLKASSGKQSKPRSTRKLRATSDATAKQIRIYETLEEGYLSHGSNDSDNPLPRAARKQGEDYLSDCSIASNEATVAQPTNPRLGNRLREAQRKAAKQRGTNICPQMSTFYDVSEPSKAEEKRRRHDRNVARLEEREQFYKDNRHNPMVTPSTNRTTPEKYRASCRALTRNKVVTELFVELQKQRDRGDITPIEFTIRANELIHVAVDSPIRAEYDCDPGDTSRCPFCFTELLKDVPGIEFVLGDEELSEIRGRDRDQERFEQEAEEYKRREANKRYDGFFIRTGHTERMWDLNCEPDRQLHYIVFGDLDMVPPLRILTPQQKRARASQRALQFKLMRCLDQRVPFGDYRVFQQEIICPGEEFDLEQKRLKNQLRYKPNPQYLLAGNRQLRLFSTF
eukprot:GHVN01083710.1.p1 GENE.GHVN01083710.1~~GHVN01083710.1.p1  ORF type:complete len:915 (+),score=92.08 GHVN01083710.1:270-2747(+)